MNIRAGALGTIFEAFRRADESEADGLGLGLLQIGLGLDVS
jgi:signal transduction histidine kinase